jgi:Domain of unknown function (DUF4390)
MRFPPHFRPIMIPALRAVAIVLVALACTAAPARADVIGVKQAELRVEDEALVLNAEFDLALNATLDEALQKGIPLYFVLEFELTRPRWYWLDEKVLTSTTQYRVAWQALTQTYRISSGLLAQTPGTAAEVERFLSRVTAREVGRRDQVVRGDRYIAAVRLRLDTNQLPKPFQVNAITAREWTLDSGWHRWNFTP